MTGAASGTLDGDTKREYLVALTDQDVTIYRFDEVRDDGTFDKRIWMRQRPPGSDRNSHWRERPGGIPSTRTDPRRSSQSHDRIEAVRSDSMNLLILGASGGTGRHLVSQALAAGHRVTAVSRHPETAGVPHRNLSLATGDVAEDPSVIERVLPGHDAVLSALGRGLSFAPKHLSAHTAARLIPAMESLGPKRLVWLSACGVAPDYDGVDRCSRRLFFRTLLKGIYADKSIGDAAVRESRLEWTIICPVRMTNDRAIGKYRVGERLDGVSGANDLTRDGRGVHVADVRRSARRR